MRRRCMQQGAYLKSLFVADRGNKKIRRLVLSPLNAGGYSAQVACPEGTYLASEGGRSADDCIPCPAGKSSPQKHFWASSSAVNAPPTHPLASARLDSPQGTTAREKPKLKSLDAVQRVTIVQKEALLPTLFPVQWGITAARRKVGLFLPREKSLCLS